MDDQPSAPPVDAALLQATVELADEDGPIRGVLRADGRPPRKFFGWLELMDALEQLRASRRL
jgi:hypothetical protein